MNNLVSLYSYSSLSVPMNKGLEVRSDDPRLTL